MKKVFIVLLILSFNCAFAFSFKKKLPQVTPKMPETKQQWMIEAQNVPLDERELKTTQAPKSNKKHYYPESRYVFEKYNYPQGKASLDVSFVKKNLVQYPIIVADKNCHYVAYAKYYYSPDINQISSEFYVAKLDRTKTRTKRILEYNHKQEQRTPIIEAGTKEVYPNLFKGLALVDWSSDSKKLLIKEKVGSTLNGIYKTYLYIHTMGDDINSGYTKKLTDFDEVIKNYFLDYQNLQLVKYRYDIEPLGFSADNDDVIVVLCYVYDKDNNKIFLGSWGYNIETSETMLFSKTNSIFALSINGLVLKQTLE